MRTALLYNFLIEANLMASIAILLMMILRKTLRRQLGNGALCFGWLLVAIRLLLPLSLPNPFINALRSPFALDAAIRPIAGQVKVRLGDALSSVSWRLLGSESLRGVGNRLLRLNSSLMDATLSYRLANIYILGVGAVIAWAAISNLRFRLRLRAGRIEPISGKLLSQYETLCAQRGVRPVPVYFTDPLPSACLVGVIRPYIALPLTASPQGAIHVLTHEVCHLKNRDHIWNVVRLCCCALHWFNPLVWLAAAMSRTDGELRCDDRVTAPLDQASRQAYANVLVLAAARRNAPGLGVLATGMTMTGRRLKTRVVTILQEKKPLRWLGVCFALLASMCLVGAFATAEVRVVPRIFRSHPAISRETITDEPTAIAYAKILFGLDDLGHLNPDGLTWRVENAADDPDECAVYAVDADGNDCCEAVFDRAGNVKSVWYTMAGEYQAVGFDDKVLTPEQQSALAEDLVSFLALVNPAQADRANVYQYIDHYRDFVTGSAMVDVAFWNSEDARDNNDDTSAYFTVQLAPDVRILRYTCWYGSANGNG